MLVSVPPELVVPPDPMVPPELVVPPELANPPVLTVPPDPIWHPLGQLIRLPWASSLTT